MELFLCRSPLKPHMRSNDVRMQTFTKYPHVKRHSTPREMAVARFYYLGSSDRVICFYWAGGLKNWESDDNPWYEQAKWYHMCEYVLRNHGVEYGKDVCIKHVKVPRLRINNPSKVVVAKSLHEILSGHVSGSVEMADPKAKKKKQ